MENSDREKILQFLANLKDGGDPSKDIFAHYTKGEIIALAGNLHDIATDIVHGMEYS